MAAFIVITCAPRSLYVKYSSLSAQCFLEIHPNAKTLGKMPKITSHNLRNGFTLLELVVTLGVLAFLLKISVPRLYNLQVETTLDTAARQVTQAVSRAETLAEHSVINNTSDQTMQAGGIADRNDIKTYMGTVLTAEDVIAASSGRERLAIREWTAARPDVMVGKTDATTLLKGNKTDDALYPVAASIILPDRTGVTKFKFHWLSDNSDNPDNPADKPWPVEEAGGTWFIPFASDNSGRPTGEPFVTDLPPAVPPAPPDPLPAGKVVQPHVLITIKRDTYTESCRLVTIDLTNGGTSSRTGIGTECD